MPRRPKFGFLATERQLGVVEDIASKSKMDCWFGEIGRSH